VALSLVSADEKPAKPSLPMLGGTPARNAVNLVDKNVTENFAVRPKGKEKGILWKAELGSMSYTPPVIAGGQIYVATNNQKPRDKSIKGDRGVMMCFKESDGSFLWQITHEKADPANDTAREPLISAPVVEGDRLYYVSNRAEMVCADTKGKIIWIYDMPKELDVFVGQHVYTSPLMIGDLVYAMTCNGRDVGTGRLPKPDAPAFVAINKKTGKLTWKNNLPGANIMDGQWTNPSAAKVNGKWQVIYGGGDGWLYSLDATTGDLIWKFDCNPKNAKPYKHAGSGEQCFIIATPVIHDNKCYIAVGQEPDDGPGVGHLWCIDLTKKPANKDKDLSPVNNNFDPKAPENKDSGLVWHLGGKIVPAPKNADREYHFGRTLSTVCVHEGIVYAAELTGYLSAIDVKTGKRLWEHDFTETTWCSPYYVDGKVFMGTDSGKLYIFKHGKALVAPKALEIGPPVKVAPVVVNGVLYLNAGNTLYAIK
jgi:outer membrane protein assembly factor BamB